LSTTQPSLMEARWLSSASCRPSGDPSRPCKRHSASHLEAPRPRTRPPNDSMEPSASLRGSWTDPPGDRRGRSAGQLRRIGRNSGPKSWPGGRRPRTCGTGQVSGCNPRAHLEADYGQGPAGSVATAAGIGGNERAASPPKLRLPPHAP
jgi:hypothetical protein